MKTNKAKPQHNMCWTQLYANKLGIKTYKTWFLCENRSGHHNTELRT